MDRYDVIVVGAGPSGSAAAKRCVDGGLKTLLVDKQKLPRRKACSGIIMNSAQNYVLENFGPLPPEVFGTPTSSRGMCFYFPSAGPVFVDVDCYAPYVWRDRFDHFLAKASGADLQDRTRFVRMEGKERDGFQAVLLQRKKTVRVRARYLVAADGARSHVVHTHAPDVYSGMPWLWACQKYYEGTVDADDRYLYYFLVKGMGPFPWLNIKDGQIIIGLAGSAGEKFRPMNETYLAYLKRHVGLELGQELATEGCFANTMTPLNRFFPGRGRILAVGDAMGLMHQGGEGISCGMASGGHAGEAILRGLATGSDPLALYRDFVREEAEIALDQFNPLRLGDTAASALSRRRPALDGFTRREKALMFLEAADFVRTEFGSVSGILPTILKNSAQRLVRGKYNIRMLS
jgi:flavin-dependent dehydrogenase